MEHAGKVWPLSRSLPASNCLVGRRVTRTTDCPTMPLGWCQNNPPPDTCTEMRYARIWLFSLPLTSQVTWGHETGACHILLRCAPVCAGGQVAVVIIPSGFCPGACVQVLTFPRPVSLPQPSTHNSQLFGVCTSPAARDRKCSLKGVWAAMKDWPEVYDTEYGQVTDRPCENRQ